MPTPSSSLLHSSFYSRHQPSIPKPVAFKSRRGRSRSTSPTTSSSSSSYSTYNTTSYRKPPRIEIATGLSGTDRVKRFSKVDDDDDYLLDHKINAFKSLERLNRPTTGKYRPSTELGSDFLSSSSKSEYSVSPTRAPRFSSGTTRASQLDSPSWDSSTGKSSRYTASSSAAATKSSGGGSHESPRSRESSPVNNSSTPLSRKIAEFLNRTDHVADEWSKVGAKKNKTRVDDRNEKIPSRLSNYGDDLPSRCNSRLSNRDEDSRSDRQSTLGDGTRAASRLNTERDSRSVSRFSSDARPKSSLSLRDEDEGSRVGKAVRDGKAVRETRSVSRMPHGGATEVKNKTGGEAEGKSKAAGTDDGPKPETFAAHGRVVGDVAGRSLPPRTEKQETRLGEITEDYADEHSTATLATERLHIESAERARLERELAEAQSANKRLAETSDKLEAEMQCLRSTDALSLEAEEESGGGSEGGDVVYRKKWERAMRELELAKHRLSTQHQDDLEQMVGLRKQLEKKIADAHEQTDEQRQVAAEWKRKQTRLSSELADTRLLLEEQSSRNNLLEKKQRKFDAEFSLLQDELRQERNLKEKAMRDKELALGDKYTMEQSMSSLKLELELKDTKLAGLASELEELQFSSNTEEEVAALKKKKHALEARLKDQEEELDELAGQVQMLEQAKLKVEMSLEQMRKAHRKELSCKDEELEALRCSTQKKVKALQSQLESEHDSRSSLLRERHEMERRLSALADQGVATQAADAETMQRLKRDLKRTKALLKDTQTMLAQARQDNPNRLLLRQLRNQLEDAELARSVATKARLSLESDLADLTLSLEETSRAKGELEARLSEALRERSSLQSTLDENEEEMTEVLKKYQASVAQLSSEQAQLQEAATRVAELETDNAALKEQLADLSGRLESIEAHGDPSSTLALKRLMLKGKELESKLEFEHTTRSRLEVQISRLKETSDKLQAECNLLRGKDNSHSQEARRHQRSIRELKETVQGLEARGVNEALKRKELEKEVQCREAEIASLKNELSVSSQRIQDLQHAIQGDLDDEYDDEDDSDARNSSSLSDDTKE